MNRNKKSVPLNFDSYEDAVNGMCLDDNEIFNVSVNFSIIRHNEWKSMEHVDPTTRKKTLDCGVESRFGFEVVHPKNKS